MLELTSAQRRTLKSVAHHLEPVVIIGDAGLTASVQREIAVHLGSHELIKVRVAGDDREARVGMLAAICEAHGAAPVQHIGKILVVYRPKPEVPDVPDVKKKPAPSKAVKRNEAHKKAPSTRKAQRRLRKTKRAYQR